MKIIPRLLSIILTLVLLAGCAPCLTMVAHAGLPEDNLQGCPLPGGQP